MRLNGDLLCLRPARVGSVADLNFDGMSPHSLTNGATETAQKTVSSNLLRNLPNNGLPPNVLYESLCS